MNKSKLLKWIIGITCGIAIIALTSTAVTNVKGWFKNDDDKTTTSTSVAESAEAQGFGEFQLVTA